MILNLFRRLHSLTVCNPMLPNLDGLAKLMTKKFLANASKVPK